MEPKVSERASRECGNYENCRYGRVIEVGRCEEHQGREGGRDDKI